MKFVCQRLVTWALHALKRAEPSCEHAGQGASSRWPRRSGFIRQSLLWTRILLIVSAVVCSSRPPSHPCHTKGLKVRHILKCSFESKALGLKTSSPNNTMPLSHVALTTSLCSQFLFRRCKEKANMDQIADRRKNPKVRLYLTLVSSKLPCCDQREDVWSKWI